MVDREGKDMVVGMEATNQTLVVDEIKTPALKDSILSITIAEDKATLLICVPVSDTVIKIRNLQVITLPLLL